jgi:Predicted DNA-binding protein with PD1-like DNA-binding motif
MVENVRVLYATGTVGKSIAARLLPGTDLLLGIEEICRQNGVLYASIANCFGSFQRAGYLYLVPQQDAKVGAGYGEIKRVEGPVEFLNGTGVVCQRDGKYDIHFHATMCDKEGKVFGGHMVIGENPVLTTVDLVINEIKDVQLLRNYDEETDLIQFDPKNREKNLFT